MKSRQRRGLLITGGAWPFLCWADAALGQSKAPPVRAGKPVVGILSTIESARRQVSEKMFVDAMRDLGWVEGKNIVYERAHADNDRSRLPAAAAALVSRKPHVIQVADNLEALAAFEKAGTIPIVFAAVAGPVEIGLVQSLARPGGNVTGVATIGWELGGKRLQLLKEAMPKLARVGAILAPTPLGGLRELRLIDQAAAGTGVKVIPATAKDARDLDAALASHFKSRVEALLVAHSSFLLGERRRILDGAAAHRIPVVAHRSQVADDGALMSYSSILAEQYQRAAQITHKILKGAKPSDIPVEQPTRFELVVNMKTARTLGITMPQSILARADRVIE